MAKKLTGRVDNVEAAANPNVEWKEDTFKINVKNDEGESVYSNEEEPYKYPVVPSLETALEYFGAVLSDDQKTFLKEALSGDSLGPATKELVDIINDSLRQSAKGKAYAAIFNEKKPLSEETIGNAHASMVRNFMKTKNVSDETAHKTLQEFGVIPADFTLEQFRANKGKR